MSVLTHDYTYQFTDTGVLLNSDASPTLPFTDITQVQGLDSAPVRSSSNTREGQDGGFLDASFSDMRTIILTGTIYCPVASIEAYLDTLYANYAPSAIVQPFYFYHPGVGERVLFCKSLGVKCDTDTLRRTGQGAIQIQLQAEDPTKFGDEVTFSGTIAAASTGRGYNKSYNYGYGGSGSGGGCSVINSGNKPAPATILLTNVDDPILINDTTGDSLSFDIDIGAGLSLLIDLRNKTALLNGYANVRYTLLGGSSFFYFGPGSTNLRFDGIADGGTATAVVTLRPAFY